ncbi:unnamed protein product [Closterium sp. Yama58-4]|nr:unnamed protein product [Closterium sp. Yama58-4]
MLGSPWALPSSPAAPQKLELDETTLHNRVEVEQGAAEQTGPTDHHPPHPRSRPQQATVDQDARGSPQDHAAGGQRVEQREQVDARDETTIPPSYDEWLLPCRPASGARAPSRTAPAAPPRHGHSLHGAHGAHSHSTAREIAGEIARVGAVAQGIGPRDEESEAAGVLTAATNAQRGIGDERRDDEVIAAASNGEQGTGGGASNDLGTGSAIPRAEANGGNEANAANAAERATEISRGDHRGAYDGFRGRLIFARLGPLQIAPLLLESAADLFIHPHRSDRDARGRSRRRMRAGSRLALRGTVAAGGSSRLHQGEGRNPRQTRTGSERGRFLLDAGEEQRAAEGERAEAGQRTPTSRREGGL